MIDIILASVILAAFYGGFKAGNRFKTMRELFSEVANALSGK